MMSKDKQDTGSDTLPNNWSATPGKGGNSTGPKISGSGGGNVTGPELTHKKGQQSNG